MPVSPELLLAVAAAAATLVLVLLVQAFRSRGQSAADARLADPAGPDSGVLVRGRLPKPKGRLDRLDDWFDQAVGRTGLDISPAGTLAFIGFCGVALGGAVYFWKDDLVLTAGAALAGVTLPLAGVVVLQGRYRKQLQDQLPDALYMLARSLRAGLSVEQAVEALAQQGNPPLAGEFGRAAGQVRVGLPITTALAAVDDRVRLLDFNVFVSTVSLYRQSGGNLALLLDRLAASVRERNLFRGRFAAATAQGRVVAVILGLFGPALLLGYAIWEPEHIRAFFDSATGWTILAGCLALEAAGVVWMWRVLQPNY